MIISRVRELPPAEPGYFSRFEFLETAMGAGENQSFGLFS